MIFDLLQDFADVISAIPRNHPRHRVLSLFGEAIRRDMQFIHRHPTTLFQCMWNNCWWYDCGEAEKHFDSPDNDFEVTTFDDDGEPIHFGSVARREGDALAGVLEDWLFAKESRIPGFRWLRSLRPPELALGIGQRTCLRGHHSKVTSVASSRDGCRIVSGSFDCSVRAWDAESGRELACLTGHKGPVWSVACTANGALIISGGRDQTVRVWDALSGRELACLRGHQADVTSVACSAEGRFIVSGSQDNTVRVWDAVAQQQVACLRGHTQGVTGVACTSDGRRIVSGSRDQSLRVWSARNKCETAAFTALNGVTCVACTPEGRTAFAGSASESYFGFCHPTIQVWDLADGRQRAVIQLAEETFASQGLVTSVACSHDGRLATVGLDDWSLQIWDVVKENLIVRHEGHADLVASVAFSCGDRRVVSASYDNSVRVWISEVSAQPVHLIGHDDQINEVAFSPDSRYLASAGGRNVLVLDATNGIPKQSIHAHDGTATSVTWLCDGQSLVSGSTDRTARVWDVASGRQLRCFNGHKDRIETVACSPVENSVVSGSVDGELLVWDAVSGEELGRLEGHSGSITKVAWSPDGKRIASQERDEIRVWCSTTYRLLSRIEVPLRDNWRQGLAFSTDNSCLVRAGTSFGSIFLQDAWDVKTGERVGEWDEAGDAAAVAIGPGRYPLGAATEGAVGSLPQARVAVAVTGKIVAYFPAYLWCIATRPDGQAWAGSSGRHLYYFRLEGSDPYHRH